MFGYICKQSIFHYTRRFAGHSKWANIKHIKALKDSKRALLFTRLCQRMKIAIQEGGGPNPSTNIQLEQAIEVAKKNSMPSASIQNCIKSALVDKTAAKSLWYEIKGPNGCFLIALAFTDNSKRTRDSIAPILRKHQCSLADRACRHLFEQKGEIVAVLPASDITNINDLVIEHAIECGAEEVCSHESEDGSFKFICDLQHLNIVSSKLQALKYTVKSADFNFIPNIRVQLSDGDLETMSKLMDKLEDHPDIVGVYDNIA